MMINALFFDPRLKALVNDEYVNVIIEMFSFIEDDQGADEIEEVAAKSTKFQFLTERIQFKESRRVKKNSASPFQQYFEMKSEAIDTDPFEFWKAAKSSLVDIAMLSLCSPCTQVSVECLFSSLAFIFSPLRGNLKGKKIMDILLIRENADLFNEL